jgi:homoserine kinase type II
MAVYTDITEIELADCLKDYDIGTLLSYKGIAEGVENTNFLLRTTKGTFILTLYEKRVNKDDLPFFLGLMEHLAARGLSCPLPVHRNDGEMLSQLAGRPAAIITFLEGMWLRKPQAIHCFELGAAMANFHQSGQDFEISRKNALDLKDWRPLWEQSRDQANSVQENLTTKIDAQLTELENHWPKDLPRGVIHADLFPDNVFFIGNELSGLIDFYFACNDMFAYDLAICLNAWCFETDGSYNMTKGRALLKGYQSLRPLEEAERQALPILARGAAMRFFLTRLFDWINVPDGAFVVKKDPLEYMQKLRFHTAIKSSSEYGLM